MGTQRRLRRALIRSRETPPRLFYLGPSSFTNTPEYGAGIYHRFRFRFDDWPDKPFLFMLPHETNPGEQLSMAACHAILLDLTDWCRGVLRRNQWTPFHNLDEAPPAPANAVPETEVSWIVPGQN